MIDLAAVDLDDLVQALQDQSSDAYDVQWLIDPRTGEVTLWTSETGIGGRTQVDVEELDLTPVEPIPPHEWWQDMADFAEGVRYPSAARQMSRALDGRGAFRRFRDVVFDRYPDLTTPWNVWRDVRARRRAVEWLHAKGLITEASARQYAADHPDPVLP